MSTLKCNRIENTSTASGGLDVDSTGKIRITTLADSSGNNNSTPAEIASGRAKAWINFNGTGTISILRSFNVSSITDEGTGQYLVNFSITLNANACVVVSNGNDPKFVSRNNIATGAMTSTTQAYFAGFTSGAEDPNFCAMAVFDT